MQRKIAIRAFIMMASALREREREDEMKQDTFY